MKNLVKLLIVFLSICSIAVAQEFTKVRAKHILVGSEVEAIELKRELNKGADFSILAMRYSQCPSGRNGGELGYFERGQMVPEFEKAAFSTPVGQVTAPVHTQFGWHLILVEDKE